MKSGRRSLGLAGLLCAVSLAATACMGSSEASDGGATTIIFTHSSDTYSKVFKQTAFPELAEKNITVTEEIPASDAKLQAQLQAGNVSYDAYYTIRYIALGKCDVWFQRLDFSRIDTSHLDMSLATPCSVPLTKSYFVLVYNADTYKDNPPQSWADFYDPVKFPGNRGIMNFPKDAGMETALLASGVPADKLYPLDYDRAFATLDTIRPFTKFYTTGAQQAQALQSGEVDMMLAWQGRAADAQKAGANLKAVWNQAIEYGDAVAIPKGAPHPDQAYALLNAIIDESTQRGLSEAVPYSSVNNLVTGHSDPILAAFANEPQSPTTVNRDDDWWAANLDDATARWTKWVNG